MVGRWRANSLSLRVCHTEGKGATIRWTMGTPGEGWEGGGRREGGGREEGGRWEGGTEGGRAEGV